MTPQPIPGSAETGVTWLFVPGDRPERFAKATESGADRVIIDLEDSVDAARHNEALAHALAALASGGRYWLRITAPGSPHFGDDLAALATASAKPDGVIVPKAEDPADLAGIAAAVGAPVIALIESARGVLAAPALARAEGVVRLAFGGVDYSAELGAEISDELFAHPRSVLVVASRAADLPAPLDTPAVQFRDTAAVRESAAAARRLGMGGKLCIHPAQLEPVRTVFRVSAEQVAWAQRVLNAANGTGAAAVDGEMIDRPVLERARRILGARSDL